MAGDRPLNDIVVFDCAEGCFKPAEQRGAPPEPRCRHTLELVGPDLYCILGYKAETAVGPDVFSLQIGSASESIDRILGRGNRAAGGGGEAHGQPQPEDANENE